MFLEKTPYNRVREHCTSNLKALGSRPAQSSGRTILMDAIFGNRLSSQPNEFTNSGQPAPKFPIFAKPKICSETTYLC